MPKTKTKTKKKTKKTKKTKKKAKETKEVKKTKVSKTKKVATIVKKKAAKKKETVKKVRKKLTEKKVKAEKKKPVVKSDRYYQAEGRRKTAVARIRAWTKGEKEFLINQKKLEDYFPTKELQKVALSSLETMKCTDKFKISVVAKGGGVSSQAEAVRHGTAKILVMFNPDFRKRLKKAGFLRRDDRMRERKKFGLKRARRAPQWRKR